MAQNSQTFILFMYYNIKSMISVYKFQYYFETIKHNLLVKFRNKYSKEILATTCYSSSYSAVRDLKLHIFQLVFCILCLKYSCFPTIISDSKLCVINKL